MESEKVFRTKTGFCHILPDKIVLTRDGIIGNVAEAIVGNSLRKILVIYGVLSAVLLYFAFKNFQDGQVTQSIFLVIIALFLIYGIFASLNNSTTSIIQRNKIKKIQFKKRIFGLTRSRLEVIFENDKRETKRRLIMLPGSLTDGKIETERAIKIMIEEKLLSK